MLYSHVYIIFISIIVYSYIYLINLTGIQICKINSEILYYFTKLSTVAIPALPNRRVTGSSIIFSYGYYVIH